MSEFTRRRFLQVSAGAIGGAIAASRACAAPQAAQAPVPRTKIYTVFGHTNPSADDTSVVPVSDAELLGRLLANCPGVEFVVRDEKKPGVFQSMLNEVRDLKNQGYDGVLHFGAPRHYGPTETGLPTIVVYSIHDFMNIPYTLFAKRGKVLTATIDRWHVCSSSRVSDQMEKDLAAKVKLISALAKMRTGHIRHAPITASWTFTMGA